MKAALLLMLTASAALPYSSGYTVDTTKFASKTAYASSFTEAEANEAKSRLSLINHYCTPVQVIHLYLIRKAQTNYRLECCTAEQKLPRSNVEVHVDDDRLL